MNFYNWFEMTTDAQEAAVRLLYYLINKLNVQDIK